ncbi:uncharacterized protein LOC125036272 isoform X1 [Penaeus chinensis]|uniref:uncharacterized protein LOC125036272 isoform X1 n=1 Tax=Penaeus chinensis TaxID=139456 RepID=UPI001FB57A69|nr:uncharacterized protein LOC125036272 isoform X1 [Penaeus chinensis]
MVALKSWKTRYEWEWKEFPKTKACLSGAQGKTSLPWGSVHTTWRRWSCSLASAMQYTKALPRKGMQIVEQFLMTASPVEFDALSGGTVADAGRTASAKTKAGTVRTVLTIVVRVRDKEEKMHLLLAFFSLRCCISVRVKSEYFFRMCRIKKNHRHSQRGVPLIINDTMKYIQRITLAHTIKSESPFKSINPMNEPSTQPKAITNPRRSKAEASSILTDTFSTQETNYQTAAERQWMLTPPDTNNAVYWPCMTITIRV